MAKKSESQDDFLELLISTFKLIGKSWNALLLNLWTFVAVALIPALVIIMAIILVLIPFFTNGDGRLVTIIFAAIAVGLAIFVGVLFLPAITITQLASARNEKVEFSEVFKKSRTIALPFLGLAIIIGLTVLLGFIFLIIPGIIAAFFLSMAMYILIDKNPGVINAYKQSFYLVKENFLIVLALYLVNMGVSAVSYIPYLGWIASLALTVAYFCLPAIIYVKISKK